ncbi:lymphocyte antigen 6D-like [Oncorhynchus kisutch]|uniref:lymphocyte antigen 6D-like n=1 Tax=Oncorhynchus kisutch TaxID=8019 RepID=UPI0012DE2648|nr:lymphocyte antigen 6D-like [Oncorhynchus kisutch]
MKELVAFEPYIQVVREQRMKVNTMASMTLALTVLVAVFCATVALKCHKCTTINPDHPTCTQTDITEVECGVSFTHCARIVFHKPAYGEVRKCATENECNVKSQRSVVTECCTTDLCN